MYKFSDIYDADNAPSFASAVLAVGASALFSIGLLLILNAHNNSQTKHLQQTIAAIQKSQDDGTDINTALAEIQASNDGKYISKTSATKTSNSSTSVDNLTVKNDSNLQGGVKVGRDVAVNGKLESRGDTTVGGVLSTKGDIITEGSLGVAGSTSLNSDLTVTGDTMLDGDLTVTGSFSFASEVTMDSDLTVGGTIYVSDADGNPTDIQEIFQGTLDTALAEYQPIGNYVEFDDDGNSSIAGSFNAASITIGIDDPKDINVMFVQNDPTDINGDPIIQNASIRINGGADIGGNIVGGGSLSVHDNATIGTSGAPGTALNVYGDASFSDDLAASTATFGRVDGNNQLTGGNVRVYGDLTVGGGDDYSSVPNLLTTTDFTNIAWTNVGWATTSSTATHNVGNTSALSTTQVSPAPTAGQKYLVSYTVSGAPAAGSTLLTSFAGTTLENRTFTGGAGGNYTLTEIYTATNGNGLSFTPSSNFNGTISAVSIKLQTAAATGGVIKFGSDDGGLDFVTLQNAVDDTTNPGSPFNYLKIDGTTSIDGDLNVSGNVKIGGTSIDDIVSAAVGSAGYLSNGDDITAGALTATGNIDADSFSVGGVAGDDLIGRSNADGSGGCNTNYHVRIKGVRNGIITDVECGSDSVGATNYDLAENYPSTQVLSAGDVVSIDTTNAEHVVKSSGPSDDLIIGVVSTAPGYTLGSGGPGYPIALSGRVPVKVTNEGGPIVAGDYLTSSSTSGYAKKAAFGDKTIGQALTDLNGTSGTVVMFVSVSKSNSSSIGVVQSVQSITQGSMANLSGLNVSGPSTLSDLSVTGSAIINNLSVTGTTSLSSLTVNGHLVGNDDTRGSVTIPAGAATIHRDFISPYSKKPAVVASPTGQAVLYSINATPAGFDITLSAPATADVSFDYLVQE